MKNKFSTHVFFFILAMVLLALALGDTRLSLIGAGVIMSSIVFALFIAAISKTFKVVFVDTLASAVKTNNHIFEYNAVFTFILLVCLLFYGFGNPVSTIVANDLNSKWKVVYDADAQKTVNNLALGRSLDDSQVSKLKATLLASNECGELTPRGSETDDDYRQMVNNYMNFGCFKTNTEVDTIRDKYKNDSAKIIEAGVIGKKMVDSSLMNTWFKLSDRRWFFLNAFFLFLFVQLPLASIASFSDWWVEKLDSLVKQARQLKERNSAPAEPSASGGTGVVAKVTDAVDDHGGFLMKIMGVEIIESMVKILISALKKN